MSAVEPQPTPGQAPEVVPGQEPTGTPPQEGTPPAGQEPPGESAETTRLRQEAAKYRTELRAREAELQAIKDAQLSEEQRREQALTTATAERDQLRAEVQSVTLRADALEAARSQGIVDPDAAYRLMDTAGLTPGEVGYEALLAERMTAVAEKRPYLKAPSGETPPAPTPQIPSSNPSKPRGGGNELTQNDLKGMSREQIAALDPDVVRAAMNRT